MAEPERRVATAHDGEHIDWVAAEQSPEFKELIAKKRRFVLPPRAQSLECWWE